MSDELRWPRRAVLLDPALGNLTGHWLQYNRRISDELDRRAVKVSIFGFHQQDMALLEGLRVTPLFHELPWHPFDRDLARNFEMQRRAVGRDLATLDRQQFGPDCLLEMVTSSPGLLAGFLDWFSGFPEESGPKAAVIFPSAEGVDIFSGNSPIVDLLRRISPVNRGAGRWPNVRFFFSGCESLAYQLAVALGVGIRPLPLMAYQGPRDAAPTIGRSTEDFRKSTVRVGYFGHASLEKGAQFLDEIVRRALRELPDVHFVLHLNHNPDTKDILEELYSRAYPNVTCYWGHVEEAKMSELRSSVDLSLLLYNYKYKDTPSMVFGECMVEGKPCVIPENTWLSFEAYQLGGAVERFSDYNAESTFAAIVRAVNRIEELTEEAARIAPAWRAKHNIRNFVDGVLAEENWARGSKQEFGWERISAARDRNPRKSQPAADPYAVAAQ